MIKSVTVTNHVGDTIEISLANPYKTGFAITEITGIGSLEATINTTDVATNDGSTFNSSRTNSRNIVMTIKLLESPTIEDTRLKIYKYFPVKRKITLRIDTDRRASEIVGYVESVDTSIFSNMESAQISIICPQPYFQAVSSQITLFSGTNAMFEFPFSNTSGSKDLIFSELFQDTARVVLYEGDVETGVKINIHAVGPAKNITIYNTKTRQQMALKMDILDKDEIYITTLRNQKSILLFRDGVYNSILNKLVKNSDWFTLDKGENVFFYAVEEGVNNVQISIESRILYEGV